jgi:hypothetical protein
MTMVLASLLTVQALSLPIFGEGTGLVLRGTSECPAPAQVAALLPGMLPQTGADAQDAYVTIDPVGSAVAITVRGLDGSLLLYRPLAPPSGERATCQALALAVAVIIATWKIERSAELSLLQPDLHPPPAALAVPDRVPAAYVAAPALPAPPGPVLLLGAAVGTSVDRAGIAGTGGVEVEVRRRSLGVRLTLVADTERDYAQDGGTVTWRRWCTGLGAVWRLPVSALGLELAGQALLGRVTVQGAGFGIDRTDHALAWGTEAALRVVGAGAVQPFLEAAVRGWLSDQEVEVRGGGSDGSALPRVEGRITVGVRCRLGDQSAAP